MTAPSVIVFDLGKVLLDFDYSIAVRRIAARVQEPLNVAAFFTDHAPVLRRYELGQVTTEQFTHEICTATGYLGTKEEFEESFADIFTPIEPMLELHGAFRQRNIPTYVFSNTNELAIRHIRQRFPFFADFDGYILSYEHGAMKPDAQLYEVVERETKRTGREILYLDDRSENVAAGAGRGWRALLHQSAEMTIQAITKNHALLGEPVG